LHQIHISLQDLLRALVVKVNSKEENLAWDVAALQHAEIDFDGPRVTARAAHVLCFHYALGVLQTRVGVQIELIYDRYQLRGVSVKGPGHVHNDVDRVANAAVLVLERSRHRVRYLNLEWQGELSNFDVQFICVVVVAWQRKSVLVVDVSDYRPIVVGTPALTGTFGLLPKKTFIYPKICW
jgi:hypothetical protein